MSSELTIVEQLKNQKLQILNSSNFPIDVQDGIKNVLNIINNSQTLPELYSQELQEIPFSTSCFQDLCVQMGDHHTSHRKLRQVMLELGGKLDALNTAKVGYKKSIVKINKLNEEISELEDLYNTIDKDDKLTFEIGLRLSSITYQMTDGENTINYEIISQSLLNSLTTVQIIDDLKLVNFIKNKIKTACASKIIELEDSNRNLKNSEHLIKDAAIKTSQLQNQVENLKEEIQESGLSYEESEVIYYVMYFTNEAERQLRTGDHQIDRGTFGAISQLPVNIRRKVLKNIHWLEDKIRDDFQKTGSWYRDDYYIKTHREIFLPKITAEGEIEGMNVKEFLKITPTKILSTISSINGKF